MKKRIIAIYMLLFFVFVPTVLAVEKPKTDSFMNTDEIYKLEDISKELIDDEFDEYFGGFDFGELTKSFLSGNGGIDANSILKSFFRMIVVEIRVNLFMMLKLCAIAILSVVVLNIRSSFASDEISQVAFFVFYALCAGILLQSFTSVISLMQGCINNLNTFMNGMLGALMAVGVAGGNIISCGTMYPVLVGLCSAMGTILSKVLVPMFCFCGVLSVVNNLSEHFHTKRLCEVISSVMKWILTFGFMVFVGVLTLKGATSYTLDALGAKTLKFAISSFVPVVGGILSDATETVLGGGMLVKNTLGVVGVLIVCAITVVPMIKLIAINLIFKVSAGLLESVCDKRLTGAIWDMGKNVTTALIFIIVYGVVFIVCIASFITVTNSAFMMR